MNCIKKIIFCSVLFFSAITDAAENGDTRFSAKVFCGTCDIAIYVDGVIARDIYMGSVTLGGTSAKKHLLLKRLIHQNLSVASLPPQASILMPE
ncbi:hypothetical protein AB8O00_004591 [Escherichia coli]